ncbi:MAG: glycosyltransferase, partial [bacterium]|nr:glycosyltransferase [bacterium]
MAPAGQNVAPAVSIVVSTSDRARSLRRTLVSFEQLDYPNFEVVVVRGPCTDHTDEVLATFADRIKIGHCSSLDLSESRNLGIRMASGEYVAFIDDDAYPHPAWLDQLLRGFDRGETAAVGGPVLDHTGMAAQTQQLAADRFGNWSQLSSDRAEHLSIPGTPLAPYAMGTNGIYRRRHLVEVGGFDECFEYHLDEAELCRRLVERGYTIGYAAGAVVYHKALQSRHRTEQRVLRSYFSILKSKCLFALRHGLGAASFADLTQDLAAYADEHRKVVQANVAAGRLDAAALEAFEEDARRAFDEAWLHHLSGHGSKTQPPHWFEEDLRGFLRFPNRRAKEDRLQVCLLTDEYLPAQLNGIARTVHTLATGLAARGHVVHVLTAGDDRGGVDLEEGVWVHRVPIRPHDPPPGFPDVQLWAYSASLLDELARIDELRPIDVVQAPNWGGLGAAVLQDGRFTTVLSLPTPLKTVAEMDHSLRSQGRPRDHIQRLIDIERSSYRGPSGYLASSPSIVAEIEAQYGVTLDAARTGMVGHGLPDRSSEVEPRERGPGLEVLFVGRLEPRKGIDTLLECVPSLAGEFPELRFTIVGDDTIPGPTGATYRELFECSEVGRRLRDRVTFTGVVDEHELTQRYEECDIFVAPSRYESFGLILLEAMMFGKPVVACDAGGMGRVVQDGQNGLLVPPADAGALRQAVALLAGSSQVRSEFGRRSRRLFEEGHSAERMVTETKAFYDRLLGRSTIALPVATSGGVERSAGAELLRVNPAGAVQSTNGSRAGGEAAKGPIEKRVTPASRLPPLTGFMACPACRSPLRLVSATVSQGRTKTGQLICDACQRVSCLIHQCKYDFLIDGDVPPLDCVEARDVGALGERRVAWSDPAISYGRGWHPSGDGFMTSPGNAADSFTYTGTFTDAQVRFLKMAVYV